MNSSTPQAKTIFLEAVELDSPGDRQRLIARLCGEDPGLRKEVESLLRHAERMGDFMDPDRGRTWPDLGDGVQAADSPPSTAPTEDPLIGSRIGPYQISELIGEGGMGTVYLAEQTTPLRRQVALKLIRLGLASQQVIARFEAERQALALMNHPNIARVIDGGTTATGQPYFTMEFVQGLPITNYCDQKRLGIADRLRLFIDVCRAVHHAHQRGIIHRDLKPTNILITEIDGKPVVKVIDFGIAKAVDQEVTGGAPKTRFSQMVGTPAYMSPEQAGLGVPDIDTRSDVYSLGVLLYELLTGHTPVDTRSLESLDFDELCRVIREEPPRRPSARLRTLTEANLSTVAGQRGTDTRRFVNRLRGELDWIVLQALDKDRARRYDSPGSLAADVERHLRGEAVEACRPSWGYQVKKFSWRHRKLLAAGSLILLLIVFSTVFCIWYAIDAHAARELANQRLESANFEKIKAEIAYDNSRRLLYAADMKLAWEAIWNKDIPRCMELLYRHLPSQQEPEQRGFEWHILHKQATQQQVASLQHAGWVNDIELSPDGQWLAVATQFGQVYVHDARTWQWKRSFFLGLTSASGVGWSPDGQLLAVAGDDGGLRIWNSSSGQLERTITAHAGGANDVLFARDGRSLYSCGADQLAKQWDLANSTLLRQFETHQKAVEKVALSPDGRFLATASSDGTYAVWNTESGVKLHQSQNQGERMVSLAFGPRGRVVAGGINGCIVLFDPETEQEHPLPRQLDGIEGMVFVQQGKWLALADRSGTVELLSLEDLSLSSQGMTGGTESGVRWIAHGDRAVALTATPDGRQLISGGRDGKVQVWTPQTAPVRWRAYGDYPSDYAIGPDSRLYLSGRSLSVWELAQRRIRHYREWSEEPWKRVAVSRDGHWLAAARPGELVLLDTMTLQSVRRWELGADFVPYRLAISPDGKRVAVCQYQDSVVHLFSSDHTETSRMLPARQCRALAFGPRGQWLAVGHLDDLRLFELATDKPSDQPEFRTLAGHSSTLAAVSFSPDGTKLATASHDRHLKLWSLPDGRLEHSIIAHQGRVLGIAFSPDGRTIASGGHDGRIKLWHSASGQPLGVIRLAAGNVGQLQFTPDGQRLVAQIEPGTFEIYDASPTSDSTLVNVAPESSVEFHPLELPPDATGSNVNLMSRDAQRVIGHSHHRGDSRRTVWTRRKSVPAATGEKPNASSLASSKSQSVGKTAQLE